MDKWHLEIRGSLGICRIRKEVDLGKDLEYDFTSRAEEL